MLQQVYIVRHGETEWSLAGKHTSRSDIALTAKGESQAKGLAEVFRGISFDQVFCSPRLRAKQTCQLAGLGNAMQTENDLAEWDYGDYEGMLSADIRAKAPDWNLFRDGCPGGETPGGVALRADSVIAKLRRASGIVAVFSHGHFGRVLAARWAELPVAAAQRLLLDTAAFGILGYEHQNPDMPVIAMWNMTA